MQSVTQNKFVQVNLVLVQAPNAQPNPTPAKQTVKRFLDLLMAALSGWPV